MDITNIRMDTQNSNAPVEIILFKNKFYHKSRGVLQLALKDVSKTKSIVLHHDSKNVTRAYGTCSPVELLKLLIKNHNLYEVLHEFPHKVYFDIDFVPSKNDLDFNKFIDIIKKLIIDVFDDPDIAISGSSQKKFSLHITLNNYLIHTEEDRQHIKLMAEYFNTKIQEIYDNIDCFDTKVYNKNRMMKLINQSKKNDNRIQKIIENDDFKKHIITHFFNEQIKKIPLNNNNNYELNLSIEIHKAKCFNLSSLPKIKKEIPNKDFKFLTSTAKEVLSILPLDKSFNHDYTHLIARFCYYDETLTLNDFLSWYKQKSNDKDKLEKWVTIWNRDLKKFNFVDIKRIKNLLPQFYPNIKKDMYEREFINSFNKDKINITKIDRLDQPHFNIEKKFIIIGVGMGGGKTTQTLEFIKDKQEVLIITPNISLANNIHNRIVTEYKVDDFTIYNKISTTDKKNGKLNECDKLIICLNSLNYISRKYDYIVIDEIETLLNNFTTPFLNEREEGLKIKIWSKFLDLLCYSKKVILLDAFITTKTTNLITSLYPEAESELIYYERSLEPRTREIIELNDFHLAFDKVKKLLNEGKKLFIYYPYKDSKSQISMKGLYDLLCKETSKEGYYYNADIDSDIKKTIKNPNDTWTQKDFILTNNYITCGVNYDKQHFYCKFIFIANFNKARDIAQVSFRARELDTRKIYICYMPNNINKQVKTDDTSIMKCNLYKSLYENNLCELWCPQKIAIKKFFTIANYKYRIDREHLNEQIIKEMQDLMNKYNFIIEYNDIKTITDNQARNIEELSILDNHTERDKRELQKYYFRKQFMSEEEIKDKGYSIKSIDDYFSLIYEKYRNLPKKLRNLKKIDCHYFNKLRNRYDTEFNDFIPPINMIEKNNLPTDVAIDIFNKNTFKFITSKSKPIKILQHIYNDFFEACVIKSNYNKKSRHTKYEVVDEANEVVTFIEDTLKQDDDIFNNGFIGTANT